MIFNNRIEVYTKKEVSDGAGGYTTELKYFETVFCNIKQASKEIIKSKYSIDLENALNVTMLSYLSLDNVYKYDNNFYSIYTMFKTKNKYSYILKEVDINE